MERRSFLRTVGVGGTAALTAPRYDESSQAASRMKITRIRFYDNPLSSLTFNQSSHTVTIETDQGITGIGEGGSVDTIRQCGAMIIGEDPFRTDHLWQVMYRGYFTPRDARNWMRWEPWTWRFGISRARRSVFPSMNCSAGDHGIISNAMRQLIQ